MRVGEAREIKHEIDRGCKNTHTSIHGYTQNNMWAVPARQMETHIHVSRVFLQIC